MKSDIAPLNSYENCFYWFMWSGAIFYSIYQVHLTHVYFEDYQDVYSDFTTGWSWLDRKKDNSDEEWKAWVPLMTQAVPWVLVHHIVSYIIKIAFDRMLLYCWYIIISACYLNYTLGPLGMMCTVAQPCILYLLTYTSSKTIVWLVHLLCLLIIHILKDPRGAFQTSLHLTDQEHYILTLTMCWIQMRSISQNLDSIENNSKDSTFHFPDSPLKAVAYCLYFPTLVLGPLIMYCEFVDAVDREHQLWNFQRIKSLILNLIRYVFWLYFTELSLHFVYLNALQYHPQVVKNLNPWALYGLGYCMGQFFLNKYVVVYGINGTLCKADGIEAPPPPKCIGRIHLYSDMWKYFDRGLYMFLKKYIYIPIVSSMRWSKLLASFLCFAFVFLWHGMQINIFIWVSLNYFGLTIEELTKHIGESSGYIAMQNKYLGSQNILRVYCVLASPLLAMSAISNFYFFAGFDIGNVYVQRILQDKCNVVLCLLFFLYCCSHVSTYMKKWEMNRYNEKKLKYCLL